MKNETKRQYLIDDRWWDADDDKAPDSMPRAAVWFSSKAKDKNHWLWWANDQDNECADAVGGTSFTEELAKYDAEMFIADGLNASKNDEEE